MIAARGSTASIECAVGDVTQMCMFLSGITQVVYYSRLDLDSRHRLSPALGRYLRQAFSSLAHLYDSLSQALGGSWEGDVVLTPGLRALEKACVNWVWMVQLYWGLIHLLILYTLYGYSHNYDMS